MGVYVKYIVEKNDMYQAHVILHLPRSEFDQRVSVDSSLSTECLPLRSLCRVRLCEFHEVEDKVLGADHHANFGKLLLFRLTSYGST